MVLFFDFGAHVFNVHRVITELGGKARAMELMGHENSEVRFQALLTVQRLVSHAWAAQ